MIIGDRTVGCFADPGDGKAAIAKPIQPFPRFALENCSVGGVIFARRPVQLTFFLEAGGSIVKVEAGAGWIVELQSSFKAL